MATVTRGRILRGDQANWDGKTATAQRLDATGGTITGLAVGNEVDVLQVYGDGTSRTRGTIANAVQRIGSTVCTLVFAPGTWTIDETQTISSNFTCHVPAGCIFDVASGKTLTFACPVIADGQTHTSGLGTVVGLTNAGVRGGFYALESSETASHILNYQRPHGYAGRYTTLDTAVTACEGFIYNFRLDGVTYTRTAALTIDEPIIIEGVGINIGCTAGSVIDNTTNDVIAINIDADDMQRVALRDFGILHEAATKYAIVADGQIAYLNMDNMVIRCEDTGYGGVFLGNTTVIPDSDNFLSVLNNIDIRNYTTYGVRVNSTGHTFDFNNCKVGGGTAGGIAGYFNTEHVNVRGGQWTNAAVGGSKGLYWYNLGAGDIEGGSVRDYKIEGAQAGQYGIEIDGATHSFVGILIENVGANLTGNAGTLVKFGRAKWCKYINPTIRNPTGGGYLCEWGENSLGCVLQCDYSAATAPITVHASATRATKRVTGKIARSQVTNITTDANLRTILVDGVDDLPNGFVPVHANGAWNYWLVTLADDAASSFTLPAVTAALVRSGVKVLHDGAGNFQGAAFVDADSGGAAITSQYAGADFNVTTGALAGTTGTDVKVTLSAHTDGKIYLENRSGATRDFTVLIDSVIFGT